MKKFKGLQPNVPLGLKPYHHEITIPAINGGVNIGQQHSSQLYHEGTKKHEDLFFVHFVSFVATFIRFNHCHLFVARVD